MAKMTKTEMEELSKMIAMEVAKHPPQCLMFDSETAIELKSFAKCLKTCRRTAWTTFISAIVIALIGATFAGVGYKILEFIKNAPKI